MANALIVSAVKTIDDQGGQQHCLSLEARIRQLGETITELVIDPLSTDWHSPETANHFRSGCAPIEALDHANTLIAQGTAAVVIRGEDLIKSGYTRDERLSKMSIYDDDYPLTEAYNDLAHRFITLHNCSEDEFRNVAKALFDNYILSFRNNLGDSFSADQLPSDRWYQPITSLFRGVDCANPLIDFSGRILICNEQLADRLQIPDNERVEISAVGLGRLDGDGREQIDQIAHYDHLRQAYNRCCQQAQVDFPQQFIQGNALLEAYTCYPVVPMAFLLVSGLVESLEQIPVFLEQHAITVSGGMNLARAPWNNPALNGLITMYHSLLVSDAQYGMVHGNGGLGYRQGVALLQSP